MGDGTSDQSVSWPNAAESAWIAEEINVIDTLSRQRYDTPLRGNEDDLIVIQRILDEGVFRPDQTHELQCLGLAFGEAIRSRLDLSWVTVEDSLGRDPALQYADRALLVFPRTMISKRIEEGEAVDVEEMASLLKDTIQKRKSKTGPSRIGRSKQ